MNNMQQLQERFIGYISAGRMELLFKALKIIIPFETTFPTDRDLRNSLILIESNYATNKHNALVAGTISREEAERVGNRIKERLITLVQFLSQEHMGVDFVEANTLLDKLEQETFKSTDTSQEGSILHRIPEKMEVNKAVKCFVRIAFEEKQLHQGIEKAEYDVVEQKTIGELIEVSLVEPTSDQHFEINTITNAEQVVKRSDYTEWIFYVKPLTQGTFPLLLKIAVVEKIDGIEKFRDIVIDKEIEIVAHEVEPVVTFVEKAELDYALVYTSATTTSTAVIPLPTANTSVSGKGMKFFGMTLFNLVAIASVALAITAGAIWGVNLWAEYIDYKALVKNTCATDEELDEFLTVHPDAWYHAYDGFHNDAKEIRDSWAAAKSENTCEAYQGFLAKYPDCACSENAKLAIGKLCGIPPPDVQLNLQCDSLYTTVSNGIPPFLWRIFNAETKEDKLGGKLEKSGKYIIPLKSCCQDTVPYIFEIEDSKDRRIKATFHSSTRGFGMLSEYDPVEEMLFVTIENGEAPYDWFITDEAGKEINGRFSAAGNNNILLEEYRGRQGSYVLFVQDACQQEMRSYFDVKLPQESQHFVHEPLNISLDPLKVKGKLALQISGGKPPFIIRFRNENKHGFSLSGKSKRDFVFDMKPYRLHPGKYTMSVIDSQDKTVAESYPLGACQQSATTNLKFSDNCWEDMQRESQDKSIPFFTYYYQEGNPLFADWNCILNNEIVEEYAKHHFFYNKKITGRVDPCNDLTAKGQPPVLEFFLPDGSTIEKIYENMSPFELLEVMKRVKQLSLQKYTSRLQPSDDFIVDIVNTPRFDTPEGYYLLRTQGETYRWVNQAGPKGPIVQVAAFNDEMKAYKTARCLQQNGIDKQIFIHPKGSGFKFKVLVAGFANKKEANAFRKILPERSICPEFLKQDNKPFLFSKL